MGKERFAGCQPARPAAGADEQQLQEALCRRTGQEPTVFPATFIENVPSKLARSATRPGSVVSPAGAGTRALSHRATCAAPKKGPPGGRALRRSLAEACAALLA